MPDRASREMLGAEGAALHRLTRIGRIAEAWLRADALTGSGKSLRDVSRLLRHTADDIETVAAMREISRGGRA